MEFRLSISNPKRWCYENAAIYVPENLENSVVATGLEKVSFHSNPKERQCQRMLKLLHNCTHHTSKVMLQILLVRFQQYVNQELPDIQAGLRKGRGMRDQIANIAGSLKSKSVPEKHLFLLYWLCQSHWLCGSEKNCGKFFKRWEYQTTWPASWEGCMQVKKQQLELDMEQQTVSKLGKE